MMEKGATLRRQPVKNLLLYSLVYAGVTVMMFMIGCLLSFELSSFLPDDQTRTLTAAALINIAGISIVIKTLLSDKYEERLDRHFGLKPLVRIAVISGVHILIAGMSFSLFGLKIMPAVLLACGLFFAAVFAGLEVGEELGAGYRRTISLSGGVLMILFSLIVFVRYGLG
jgi:putative Mn2+ efflux pump MntP